MDTPSGFLRVQEDDLKHGTFHAITEDPEGEGGFYDSQFGVSLDKGEQVFETFVFGETDPNVRSIRYLIEKGDYDNAYIAAATGSDTDRELNDLLNNLLNNL